MTSENRENGGNQDKKKKTNKQSKLHSPTQSDIKSHNPFPCTRRSKQWNGTTACQKDVVWLCQPPYLSCVALACLHLMRNANRLAEDHPPGWAACRRFSKRHIPHPPRVLLCSSSHHTTLFLNGAIDWKPLNSAVERSY